MPAPAGLSFFTQNPSVIVQLVNQAGMCWTSQFDAVDTSTNESAEFKAATK